MAKEYASGYELFHLDLDTLAWEDTEPPRRRNLTGSGNVIKKAIVENKTWVTEGCYSDLLNLVIQDASEVIFLNPGIETCVENCRNRSWEPHKYRSMKDQDWNLDMLIGWVKEYETRNDEFSLMLHRRLFDEFSGRKTEYRSNNRNR